MKQGANIGAAAAAIGQTFGKASGKALAGIFAGAFALPFFALAGYNALSSDRNASAYEEIGAVASAAPSGQGWRIETARGAFFHEGAAPVAGAGEQAALVVESRRDLWGNWKTAVLLCSKATGSCAKAASAQ